MCLCKAASWNTSCQPTGELLGAVVLPRQLHQRSQARPARRPCPVRAAGSVRLADPGPEHRPQFLAGGRRQRIGQKVFLAVDQALDQRHRYSQAADLGVRVQVGKHANHVRLHGARWPRVPDWSTGRARIGSASCPCVISGRGLWDGGEGEGAPVESPGGGKTTAFASAPKNAPKSGFRRFLSAEIGVPKMQ